MTVPSATYGQYAPDQIKVDSLGIGLSYDTNDLMNLSENQYLIVGEFQKASYGQSANAYNLIVDNEGVAIRTSIPERNRTQNEYALFVDGDVFVTGRLLACNVMGCNVPGDDGIVDLGGGGEDNYFRMARGETDNIYYPNKVTLGNEFQAQQNSYTLNVSRSADITIDHAQFAIQNTQLAQLRFGILGASTESPAVINTPPGTKLEFHIGRDQTYFGQVYSSCNSIGSVNPNTAQYTQIWRTTSNNTPNYRSTSMAPHLIFDEAGNIGIRTHGNDVIDYKVRVRDPQNTALLHYFDTSEAMALHVAGSTYMSNILMWDYESASIKHLDELYIRRLGTTIPANQIEPGPFAPGSYTFLCNLGIGGPPEPDYELSVYGRQHILGDVMIEGTTSTNQFVANNSMLMSVASFCNDVYMNQDVIVNQSIRLRGQIFVEVGCNLDAEGNPGDSVWQQIQFTPTSPSLSNLNVNGVGLNTPGRFGVGINPFNDGDEVNHMLTIVKRDPYERVFKNFFEIQLYDKSSTVRHKGAFIGHPAPADERIGDGSLVIATPEATDPRYGLNNPLPQNIYFFPGTDVSPDANHIVRDDNAPTLGVFHNGRVGILTYDPDMELDVRGSVAFSGDMFFRTPQNELLKLGLWKAQEFNNVDPNTPVGDTYRGIIYLDEDAPFMGINTNPDPNYGLTVAGGLKSLGGYFTSEGHRIIDWMDSLDAATVQGHIAPTRPYGLFTWGNVGIGVTVPTSTLEIKDNYHSCNGTRLTLRRGDTDTSTTTSILFAAPSKQSWLMCADDRTDIFDLQYMDVQPSASNSRAFFTHYNRDVNKYQVVINASPEEVFTPSISNLNPDREAALTVSGNMSVLGDVSITGKFRVNTQAISISNVGAVTVPDLQDDDVFISGGHIYLQPQPTKTIIFGEIPENESASLPNAPLLRMYDTNSQRSVLARLKSSRNDALIQLENQAGRMVKFGVLSTGNASFGFVDNLNQPYITFQSPTTGERYVGFNRLDPSAMIHIESTGFGSNMLRLTKLVSGGDTSSAAAQIELQKVYDIQEDPVRWVIAGPDADYGQKLSLRYEDGTTPLHEVFCFSRDGCIGVGTSRPQFALDIQNTGSKGSLRLLNTNNDNATPQIILQSGANDFGGDESYDFRLYSSNNSFNMDMQKIGSRFPIMNVNSNGYLGFRTDANDEFNMTIAGVLNVTDAIYINGNPVGSAASNAFKLENQYLYLNLQPDFNGDGGLVINGTQPTNNLMHVFSMTNCNMMVLDSAFDEAQVHFRTQEGDGSRRFNMYRMGMSNQLFHWSFLPNSGNEYYVSASATDYQKALQFGPSLRADTHEEFDLLLRGQIHLDAVTPAVLFDGHGFAGASNGNLYMVGYAPACNIGIGTTLPQASLHVFSSNATDAFRISKVGNQGDLMEVTRDGNMQFLLDAAGNVGIGTGTTRATLDVQGTVFVANGTSALPAYSFANSPASGMHLSNVNHLAFATAGESRMELLPSGDITMGSNANLAKVTITSSWNTKPALHVLQAGQGDLLHVSNVLGSNLFKLHASGNVGIGTNAQHRLHVQGGMGVHGHILPTSNIPVFDLGAPNARWRDLYLSGDSIDMDGTMIRRDADGAIRIRDGAGLQRIVSSTIQLGNTLEIRPATNASVIQFVSSHTGTPQVYTPILASESESTLGIGIANPLGALHVVSTITPSIIAQANGTRDIFQFRSNQDICGVIDHTGNVGIGTTHPLRLLDVHANNTLGAIRSRQLGSGAMAEFANGSGTQVVIDRLGYLGIGTTLPVVPFHVIGQQRFDGYSVFASNVYMAANLEVQGKVSAHSDMITDSDIRLKANLHRIEGALDKVCALTGYTFTRTSDGVRSTGLVAQDVQQVLPEAVQVQGEYLGLAYGNMMGLLVEAVKELRADFEAFKKKAPASF
jgi:hypothetical protein